MSEEEFLKLDDKQKYKEFDNLRKFTIYVANDGLEQDKEIERLNNIIKNGISEGLRKELEELRKEFDEILKCNQRQASRIDKALEYIEDNTEYNYQGDGTFWRETNNKKVTLSQFIDELEDILEGDDKLVSEEEFYNKLKFNFFGSKDSTDFKELVKAYNDKSKKLELYKSIIKEVKEYINKNGIVDLNGYDLLEILQGSDK